MNTPVDFLVDDAYRRVWCAPGMDRQYIVGPKRFSQKHGEIGSVKIGMRTYSLPSQGERYHCFMIGDLPPEQVGMENIVNKWVSLKAHCNATSLLIDLYTTTGLHFALHRAYFIYTAQGALVLAVKKTLRGPDIAKEQPWIRWRSGASHDKDQLPINSGIEVDGIIPTNNDEFYAFQAKWRAAKERPGYAWGFVNGKRVKDLNLTTLTFGDVVEYIWDATVKEVIELPVKDLLAFDSILDKKGKYLLPRAGLGETIDFCDDIDVYILNYRLSQKYEGYYYHFNAPDSIRNVTHRDFAVTATYLQAYVEADPTWTWHQDLRVEVIIRTGGLVRPLVDEAHRIKDLFRLPEPKRLAAMVGTKSIELWHAATLENSQYPAVMRAANNALTIDMVEQAYGYNAISRILGDTPIKIEVGSNPWVKLPVGLWERSTVYEFGADGILLGWYLHDKSYEYPLRNKNARYVEAFYGYGGIGSSTIFDTDNVPVNPNVDYRFYASHIYNGVRKNDWFDVTGNSEYYTIQNGKVVWRKDLTKFSVAVRNSEDFLAYHLQLDYRDDLLAFSLNANEVRVGRVGRDGILDIPFGQTNIWMNGHELVPGIDYYENFPEFCIVNKNYLKPGPVQDIDIRCRGFCNSDMTNRPPAETGFVAYGMLSYNTRFNVREDKVNHVCIGGAIYTRDELGFAEDNQASPVNIGNGLPYMIQHPIVPMMGVTNTDTYTMLDVAEAIDKQVEDYLTIELPQPIQPEPNPIEYWWRVFSPFTTKLIYDMLNGLLLMDEFKDEYSDEFLRKRLTGYDWILQYDPALKDVDEQYIVIHPHPEEVVIELNVYQYRLLDRAIRIFLGNNVVLNRHLVIVEEGFEHDQRDHPHPHRTWESVGQP